MNLLIDRCITNVANWLQSVEYQEVIQSSTDFSMRRNEINIKYCLSNPAFHIPMNEIFKDTVTEFLSQLIKCKFIS